FHRSVVRGEAGAEPVRHDAAAELRGVSRARGDPGVVEGVEADAPAPKKPALLKGGMVVAWVYAVVLGIFILVIDQLPIAGSTELILSGSGFPPQGARMTTDLVNSTRAFVVPLLILSIVVAYGLAKDRHWSRWVMMVLLILGIVLIPAPF